MPYIHQSLGNLALALNYEKPQQHFEVYQGGVAHSLQPSGNTFQLVFDAQHAPQAVEDTQPSAAPKTRVSHVVLALLVCASLLFAFGAYVYMQATSTAEARAAIRYTTIEVQTGDSLWSLAQKHPARNMSTNELVYTLMEVNNLSIAGLTPGQILQVPASS
ncbi:LysM peptidoglycan-binding domain-containing protein [Collinsella sp. zg1085]|uniref:LysM peptidoglycan-binding domain-containing protein n=1 Tax=Collinsella sp. zg1085 TaxID=2844380 RepID=UPI001C0DC8A1|nr:LysM peptidoglycan-binding domain-containing protein [Collinsella sp. zg1085]QWT17004.1 LysM peptidoglycan-binding domain-containing protein [Collinsella sp. zg1085]